ncbi:MAG: hypothetical protein IJV00_03750 [Clostridia bacterium]|nr:hypothetical protein [Clostridia bacterium]
MSDKVAFRSSLVGYNKKDVNDYLIARANETHKLIEEKNSAITVLKKEISRVKEEALGAADGLKGEIKSEAGKLSENLGSLRAFVDSLLEELKRSQNELAGMNDFRVKAEKLDRFTSTLSEILSLDQSVTASETNAPEDRTQDLKARADSEFSRISDLIEKLAAVSEAK